MPLEEAEAGGGDERRWAAVAAEVAAVDTDPNTSWPAAASSGSSTSPSCPPLPRRVWVLRRMEGFGYRRFDRDVEDDAAAAVVGRPLPCLLARQYKFSTSGNECLVQPRSTLKAAYCSRVASPCASYRGATNVHVSHHPVPFTLAASPPPRILPCESLLFSATFH